MNRTILIAIGISCALVSAAGIMHYHQPVNQKTKLFPIVENEKWGYIDNTGKVVIVPQFWMAYDFADGMAQVGGLNEDGELKIGYINQSGKMAISPRFEYLDHENFSEGLAAVQERVPINDSYEDKWGYINKKGEMVIKPQFYEAGPFIKGIALVDTINDGWSTGQKYIDKTGRFVEKPDDKLNPPDEFSEGLTIPERFKGEELRYIDPSGKTIISDPSFQCGFPFSEGLAAVRVHENFKYGYIDQTGKFIIPPQFDGADSFTNGIAKVEIGSWMKKEYRFGYIDKTGKYIWGPSAIPPEIIGTPKIPETP